jgi:small-conductance mechanosensitive channel
MRLERIVYTLLIIILAAVAAINWRKAGLFQADNESLRARVEALENETTASTQSAESLKAATEKMRIQTSDLLKLRNEVTQLRTIAKNVETLTAENQRLRAQAQQLAAAPASASPPSPVEAAGLAGREQFPRESWSFAGYGSPEAALVSAIWAMREGDPKTYLESLAPDEQERIAQGWLDKSEAEIAAKHKSDVATISGMRVLERQNVGANEVMMNVLIEGPNRIERVRMNQIGQEWKFGGFVREQPATPPQP